MTRFIYAGMLAALWIGCSTDASGPGSPGTPDAPAAATVTEVACGASAAMTITTSAAGDAYTPPAMTIPVGGVVKFEMPPSHNVASTVTGLAVGFGATKCLQFSAAGSYDFRCTVHSFTGRITVQ